MPFYKDAMSHGNLYIDFTVEFPKSGELKNLDQLKNVIILGCFQCIYLFQILPVPKDLLTNVDKTKAELLEDFDEHGTNARAEGGRGRGRGDEDDEDDDMPRGGQRVQCAQQ